YRSSLRHDSLVLNSRARQVRLNRRSSHLGHLANPPPFTDNSREIRKILFSILFGAWGMSSFRSFGPGATLGIALSLSLLPTSGHAYTQEEQQACQPDAFRLCN